MTEEEKVDNNRSHAFWIMIAFIVGIAVMTVIYMFLANNPIKVENTKTQIQVIYDLNDPYTEEKVKNYLEELHVKYPEIALAQMKLETANGTSKVFREGNNLFGSKVAVRRPTTALGERNNHAYYSHWRQSVIDYAIWQAFVCNPENLASENSWLDFVGRVYAEDNTYIIKLKNIIKNK